MANYISLVSKSYDGRYMKLECSQAIDIPNNQSIITWTLSTIGGNSNNYSTGPTKVIINGTEVYNCPRKSWTTYEFPAAKGSVSGKHTVTHNNDGSKSITVSFSTDIYNANVTTYSDTWTLDTIPRGAQISSVSAFTDENNPTITYSNYWGNKVTTVEAYIYSNDISKILVGAKTLSPTGTSFTYSLTDAEREALRYEARNTKSLPVKFVLRTLMPDGTEYWSNNYSINMDIVNANPIVNFEAYDSNDATFALTGDRNILVKGYSNLFYNLVATPQKGATITSCQVIGGSKTSFAFSDTLNGVDGVVVYIVYDSRGNSTGAVLPPNFINYIAVTCHQEKVEFEIDGEAAKALITITGNYYQNNNDLMLYYRYAIGNSEEFTEWEYLGTAQELTENGYKTVHTINGLDHEKVYTFQCAAQDKVTSAASATHTVRITPVFDWSETDFNFNVPIKMNGKNVAMVVDSGTKSGWNYRKWDDGTCEAWKILTHKTALNTAWGSLYTGTSTARQNYPFPYKDKPVEIVHCVNGGYAGWVCAEAADLGGTNGAYASAQYKIVRPTATSESHTFYLSFYVVGEVL